MPDHAIWACALLLRPGGSVGRPAADLNRMCNKLILARLTPDLFTVHIPMCSAARQVHSAPRNTDYLRCPACVRQSVCIW
jgi:hypothetical protein